MNETNIKASFRILSEEDILNVISQKLGVLPTSVWKKGDPIRDTGNAFSYTAWQYDTDVYAALDINVPLQALEELFCPLCNKIVEIKSLYDVDVCLDIVVVIEDKVSPAMCLKQSIIEFAAKVGARIDFDVYVN